MFPAKDQDKAGGRRPWPLLIVNPDRSPERWRQAESACAEAGFVAERLPATDGEMLTEADPGLVIDAQRNRRGYNMRLAHAEPDRRSLDP